LSQIPNLPALDIQRLMRRYSLHPDKRLGQNFLVEDNTLRKITAIAELNEEETALEIGPGLGSLTRYLAVMARRVVAVELDSRLIPALKQVLAGYTNVELLQGDILSFNPAQLVEASGYVVVANIPYYITSLLLRHLLEASHRPIRLVLTVQSEVAERICASPGEMSLLALSVQVYGKPQIMAHIPAGAFFPVPKVDSAVVRVEIFPQPQISIQYLDIFFRLAKAGFSQKRKTLRNSLSGGMAWAKEEAQAILDAAGIDPPRRAQTLSVDEWSRLALVVAQNEQERP
jgi:16S rRNA (adenine1518-N6/adenine1519-N6)-dimethyltransferase